MSLARYFRERDPGSRGIRFHLIALIMLAVVPLAVIAAVLVARQSALQREAFEQSLLQTSLALSVAVDRQLNSYRVMLETLAQANELAQGRIDGFHALSERVAAKHGAIFVSLFDRGGKQIFNTLRPAGVRLPTPFRDPRVVLDDTERPPVGDPRSLKAVLETGQPVNSDLFHGLVAGRLIFTVNIPVMREGKVAYVLNAAFAPDVMTRLLHENPQFSGVPAVIFDRKGFIVGRWKDADRYAGNRANWYQTGDVKPKNSGVGIGRTPDGLEVYFSYARSPLTGWGVNVGIARSQLEQDIYTGWVIGGTLAAAGLVVGVLLALWLAFHLRQSIAGLADAASRNEPPDVKGLRTREIVQLEHALVEAAAAQQARAHELEQRLIAEARKAEAEETNRMKDHFIAVLSHELRNPLAPIRNGVYLLRALHDKNDVSKMKEIVDMLDRQSVQLTRLVNDLLDVSRITSGKIALQRARIDLRAVAHHAIETAVRLEARGHRLVRELPARPVEVMGDFARLSQVVSNLLDNAAKFTPRGGEIKLSIETEERNAVLSVEDNGRGIDPAFLPRVFTAFLQADSQAYRAEGGLGLGLSLAKALIELHGGSLEAHSEGKNKGSRFTLRIPRLNSSRNTVAEGTDAASVAAIRTLAPRRVLVVDDNLDSAATLDMLLKSLGHETCVAHDGLAALQSAAEFRPDIVLLDIGIPGLDGYEVARRLRALKMDHSFRIVALTGWGQEADRTKSQEAGFDLHLVKPVELKDLGRALDATNRATDVAP